MICGGPALLSQTSSRPDCDARFVYRPEYQAYDFGPRHPFRPERLASSLDLMQSLGLGPDPCRVLVAPAATTDALELVHATAYVDAVQRLDLFADDLALSAEARRWGL